MFRFASAPGPAASAADALRSSGAESSGTHVSDRVVRSPDRDADRAKSVSGPMHHLQRRGLLADGLFQLRDELAELKDLGRPAAASGP